MSIGPISGSGGGGYIPPQQNTNETAEQFALTDQERHELKMFYLEILEMLGTNSLNISQLNNLKTFLEKMLKQKNLSPQLQWQLEQALSDVKTIEFNVANGGPWWDDASILSSVLYNLLKSYPEPDLKK